MTDTVYIGKSAAIFNDVMPKLVGWEEKLSFMDIKLINVEDFNQLVLRFLFNTVLIFIAVHFIYAKNSRRKDFYFSYLAIGVIIFLLSTLLNSVKL